MTASLAARIACRSLLLALLIGALAASPGRSEQAAGASEQAAGGADAGHEPVRPPTGRGLANLEAFTRLLGYVRFFHPSDEAAAADWQSLALAGIQRAEAAEGPAALAWTLEELFRPVAPSVRVFVTGDSPPPVAPEVLEPPPGGAARVTAWHHFGVELGKFAGRSIYSSGRRVFEDGREVDPPPVDEEVGDRSWKGEAPVPAERVLRAGLGGGVSALVPMALASARRSRPRRSRSWPRRRR